METPVPVVEADWFYVIAGRRSGPLTLAELARALAALPDARNVLVWRSGLSRWTPAEAVREIAVLLPPPVPHYQPPIVSPPPPSLPTRVGPRFALFSALLATALVAAVILAKNAGGTYDASGPGLLASQYTKITRGSSTSYRVSYTFGARGQQYGGTGKIYHQPSARDVTVYYMAADPRDNGLSRKRMNEGTLALAGLGLIIAFVAYWRLPTDYFASSARAASPHAVRVGDSGGEHLRMERGKYHAWLYVGIAFFLELAIVGVLFALLLSVIPGASATNDFVLGLATVGAVGVTLWVYWDRWRCIEAYSSRSCSGCANISIAFVPVVAFVYANYRALLRLQAR